MAMMVVTEIIMDSGEVIRVECDPVEVIRKFTDKEGKIRDEFIEYGVDYINPKHVSLLRYKEEEEDEEEENKKKRINFGYK
ncbi:MAG: hypothetical protein PHS19_04665 [Eubacteriales bacterium]|nr:hypothetical protein [Eubacteriales bacterium]